MAFLFWISFGPKRRFELDWWRINPSEEVHSFSYGNQKKKEKTITNCNPIKLPNDHLISNVGLNLWRTSRIQNIGVNINVLELLNKHKIKQ